MAMLVVVHGKNDRQESIASGWPAKRPGKPGWYFTVLNWASENGLSSETRGRESDCVTPRSARTPLSPFILSPIIEIHPSPPYSNSR